MTLHYAQSYKRRKWKSVLNSWQKKCSSFFTFNAGSPTTARRATAWHAMRGLSSFCDVFEVSGLATQDSYLIFQRECCSLPREATYEGDTQFVQQYPLSKFICPLVIIDIVSASVTYSNQFESAYWLQWNKLLEKIRPWLVDVASSCGTWQTLNLCKRHLELNAVDNCRNICSTY